MFEIIVRKTKTKYNPNFYLFMKNFIFLAKVVVLLLLFGNFTSYASNDSPRSIALVPTNPTLDGITISPICEGEKATVVLSGLLPNALGTATYKVGNGPLQTKSGTSTAGGTFSFLTPVLSVIANGLVVEVTAVTVNGNTTNFTGKTAILVVNPKPTLATVTTTPVCDGSSATIVLSGLLPNTPGVATYKIGSNFFTFSGTSTNAGTYSFTTPVLPAAANGLVVEITKITNSNSCETTFTNKKVTLVVNPLPVVTASSNSPVCSGSNVALASNGGVSYSWSGPMSFSSTDQNPSFAASVAASGNYEVTVTNANGCVNTANTNVVVNALPTVQITGTPSVCSGGNVALTADGGVSYAWSGPMSFASTDQNPSFVASVAASGNYEVTVTDANGCVNTANTNVVVNPLPNAQITGTPLVCAGSSFSLTATGGVSYAWSGSVGSNNGLTAGKYTSSNATISRSINGPTQYHRIGDYKVTVTDANGCVNTATTTVGVNPSLTVNTLPVLPAVCEGSDFTINSIATISNVTKINSFPYFSVGAGNANDISYAWSGPNGFTSTSNNAFVSDATSANAGTYTLTVSGPGGCAKTATRDVTVNANPTITLDASAAVCVGSDITLTASSNGNVLSWFRNGNLVGLGSSLTISSADLSDAGTYTFRARRSPSLCFSEQNIELTVNSLPVVSASSNSPVCTGANVALASDGGVSYSWSGPLSFNSNDQNPSFVSSVDASGNYLVTVTDANGCVNTANTDVVVNPLPNAQITGTPLVCAGSSFSLTATGGVSYAWSGSVGSNNGLSAAKYTSSNATISRSINGLTQYHRIGEYKVTVTDANGCVNTATTTVGVNPSLTVNTLPVIPAVCEGSDFTINSIATISNVTKINSFPYFSVGAGNANDISYAWSGPNGFTSTSNNAFVSDATSANAGTYTLTVSGPGGCTKTATRNVTVTANPTITLDASAAVCVGSDITLTASSNGNVLSWFRNGNLVGLGSSFTISSADLSDAGTYTFRARRTPSLCFSEQNIELIVNPLPTLDTVTTSPVCAGSQASILLSGLLPNTTAVATFTINGGAPQTQAGTSAGDGTFSFNTPVLSPSANGSVIEITNIKVDDTSCETTFSGKTVTLTVYPVPTLSTVTTSPVCSGKKATILLSGLLPNTLAVATFTINGSATFTEAGTSGSDGTYSFTTPTLSMTANGAVVAITKIVNSGTLCETVFTGKSVVLTVYPKPSLSTITAAPVTAGNFTTIVLSGLIPNTVGTATFKIGNGPEATYTGTSSPSGTFSFPTPVLSLAANGLVVQVTKITNANGCETLFTGKTVTLVVNPMPTPLGAPESNTQTIAQDNSSSDFGIENVKFVLYPNPATDVLNIETTLGVLSVDFINMNGQKVLTSNEKQINISNLPAGTYMVRIEDLKNNVVMKKVIKN